MARTYIINTNRERRNEMKNIKKAISTICWLVFVVLIAVGTYSLTSKVFTISAGILKGNSVSDIVAEAVAPQSQKREQGYLSQGEAVFELQRHLLNSDTEFELRFESDLDFMDRDVYKEYLFQPAVSEENSGGNPFAGAYLERRVIGGNVTMSTWDHRHYTYRFENYQYTVSAEDEARFEKRVYEVVNELGLNEAIWDGAKVLRIYTFITSNCVYDYELLEASRNGQTTGCERGYTALGALDGTAVCKGIASLYQVLAKASGLQCEFVRGYVESQPDSYGNHAWNLVLLDGKWFNLDATADLGQPMYSYFLHGKYFDRHVMDTTAEFLNAHPIADWPYGC